MLNKTSHVLLCFVAERRFVYLHSGSFCERLYHLLFTNDIFVSVKMLFVANRMPYPPYRGDKLKIFNLASQLCKNHELHLITVAENAEDLQSAEFLKNHTHSFIEDGATTTVSFDFLRLQTQMEIGLVCLDGTFSIQAHTSCVFSVIGLFRKVEAPTGNYAFRCHPCATLAHVAVL
ncbi:MAG: hypothetical protein RL285_1950 [Bacteroidota bacterium]